MFENVTYTHYTTVLKRNAIPDESSFNALVLEALAFMEPLLPFIRAKKEHGIDSAACMVLEEHYKSHKANVGDGRIEVSRSIEGFSQSFDVSKAEHLIDRKMKWVRLFCFVDVGVA